MFISPRPLDLVPQAQKKIVLRLTLKNSAPGETSVKTDSPLSAVADIADAELNAGLAKIGIACLPEQVGNEASNKVTTPTSIHTAQSQPEKKTLTVTIRTAHKEDGPKTEWRAVAEKIPLPPQTVPPFAPEEDEDPGILPNHVRLTGLQDPYPFYSSFYSLQRKANGSPATNKEDFEGFDLVSQYGLPDKRIGHGGFGQVVRSQKDGHFYAFKEVQYKSRPIDVEIRDRIIQEFVLSRKVDLPHVVRTYDIFGSPYFHGMIIIVQELAPGMELFTAIQNKHFENAPHKTDVVFKNIVAAVADLHKAGVCHNDLKPENIIYDPATGAVKLIDFGLSMALSASGRHIPFLSAGTECYAPPEYFCGKHPLLLDATVERSAFAKDVWCLAIIYFNLVNKGGYPWEAAKISDKHFARYLYKCQKKGPHFFTKKFSPDLRIDSVSDSRMEVIEALLSVDPRRRPSTEQLLSLEWFSHVDSGLGYPTEPEERV